MQSAYYNINLKNIFDKKKASRCIEVKFAIP